MSYIGNPVVTTDFPADTLSGNGSTTAFTLSRAPASTNAVVVIVSGVVQDPSTYSVSGTTLTFSAAPPTGTSNISVRHLGVVGIQTTPSAGSVQYSSLNSSLQGVFVGRNKIINGSMVIDQRNSGSSVNVTPAVTAVYDVDRWLGYGSQGGKFTLQQSSDAPAGFVNSMTATSSSAYTVGASELFIVQQVIEGYNIADLNWGTANAKTVTLSFWVKSSLTGSFGGAITGYANSLSYTFSYSIPVANTWTQISITIPGPTTTTWATTNGGGVCVRFGLGVGSSVSTAANTWTSGFYFSPPSSVSVVGTSAATWQLTGVQLEVGSSATGFEYRQYTTELQLCQRYYWQGSVLAYTAMTYGNPSYIPPVSMRASPTMTAVPSNGTGISFGAYSQVSTYGTFYQATVHSTTNGVLAIANSEL